MKILIGMEREAPMSHLLTVQKLRAGRFLVNAEPEDDISLVFHGNGATAIEARMTKGELDELLRALDAVTRSSMGDSYDGGVMVDMRR